MSESYDVVVIGSGPGGYVAAIRAAQLGLKVACIEKDPTLGGTCLNVGCIPSKALLQSSEYFSIFQKHGEEHGIESKELSVNFPKMMSRKDQVVSGLTTGIQGLFTKNKITRIKGIAHFVSSQMIEVLQGDLKTIVEAKNFIVATGSEPICLPALNFDEKKILSSTGALALKQLPQKMIVIGAGVIGVELASVYSRLGTEVTVVEMLDRVCPMMEPIISKSLLQILKKQGITFFLETQVMRVRPSESGKVEVLVNQDKKVTSLEADVVLVAIGRKPYSQGLGLAEVGVAMTSKGFVTIDGNFRTSVPSIFAIGDLIEGPMLAHRASEEGVAVAEIIAGKTPHVDYMTIPNIVYTSPEVASVGFTEAEAKGEELRVIVGTFPFRANSRARCAGDEDGMVKIIADSTSRRLLGLHIIGPHASDMIHEGIMAMAKRATIEDVAYMCHGHPTYSEAIKEAALAALGCAIHI